MARGGKRQGQPGAAYGNRTDLNVNRAPTVSTPAAPAANQAPMVSGAPSLTPDQTPFPTDPSQRPGEPVTAGLSAAMPGMPEVRDDSYTLIQALMLHSPNPDLARLLARMDYR